MFNLRISVIVFNATPLRMWRLRSLNITLLIFFLPNYYGSAINKSRRAHFLTITGGNNKMLLWFSIVILPSRTRLTLHALTGENSGTFENIGPDEYKKNYKIYIVEYLMFTNLYPCVSIHCNGTWQSICSMYV